MEVTKKRVGLKTAVAKLKAKKWLRCTLWLSAQYEQDGSATSHLSYINMF